MTINITIVTSDAVVFGCDSIASATTTHIDPFQYLVRDGSGATHVDDQGNWTISFKPTDITSLVTWARAGVTKMFALSDDQNPVAAVTCGLAALNGKNIASLVGEFRAQHATDDCKTTHDVASSFASFMTNEYELHCGKMGIPQQFWPHLEFLVGGYGSNDSFPCTYRINLSAPIEQRLLAMHGVGDEFSFGACGIAWAGQADAVERLVFGYDNALKTLVEAEVGRAVRRLHKNFTQCMLDSLQHLSSLHGAEIPDGFSASLPPPDDIRLPWDTRGMRIDTSNLPLQDAIDMAAYLVNLQSGRDNFSSGVPTVGGRTHVGFISRGHFQMLNEPELVHRNTGYDRSL